MRPGSRWRRATARGTCPSYRSPVRRSRSRTEGPGQNAPRGNLCVFDVRLTEEKRDAIYKAAGPAKASKFVRTLAVAAARNDEAVVKAIMKETLVDA
jgi:hypothetical protein